MKETMSAPAETQGVADAFRVAVDMAASLEKELDRISELARFPGKCGRWPE